MPLAIIGLVCPEARVKFKNIDFQTEADFAYYCKKEKLCPDFNSSLGHDRTEQAQRAIA